MAANQARRPVNKALFQAPRENRIQRCLAIAATALLAIGTFHASTASAQTLEQAAQIVKSLRTGSQTAVLQLSGGMATIRDYAALGIIASCRVFLRDSEYLATPANFHSE
jgi:hypothetical protein